MIRLLLTGLWVCILTAGASYAVAYRKETGSLLTQKEEYIDGLQYHKTRVLSVPMTENGSVKSYIISQFVYTVDTGAMQPLQVPPDPLVVDDAFRKIYAD